MIQESCISVDCPSPASYYENMSAIELETAVQQLPPDQLERFANWFEHFVASRWDRQIESDILAGRLDGLAAKADADFEAGRCTPL